MRSRLQTDRQTTGGQTTETERRERASQQRAAGAAGRRGEDGERQARALVCKLAATRTPGNTGPLGIAHGVLGHQVHAPAKRRESL